MDRPCVNLTMCCSFTRSRVCHGGISSYASTAVRSREAVSGRPKAVSARRAAHTAPCGSQRRRPLQQCRSASVAVRVRYCISVLCCEGPPTHPPWYCGQDAVGAPLASVDSRGSPSARLALFALCPSRAGGGGAFNIMYHSCTVYSMPPSL